MHKGDAFQPNGCGPKTPWPWVKVPDFVFRQDCNAHDLAYHKGGTEADRKAADEAFLAAMLKSAKAAHWSIREYYRVQAWWYYAAVRKGGSAFFNHRAPA